MNSILYQSRTDCQWALLPNDLPPKSATYYYFAAWLERLVLIADQPCRYADLPQIGGDLRGHLW